MLDIAQPGGGYRPGGQGTHIEVKNATPLIYLVKIEKHNQTHYKATIWGHRGTEYVGIGDMDGETIPFHGIHNIYFAEISGTVHITIPNDQEIEIEIQATSNISFKDFSDSIVVWANDTSDSETAVRKFYDPPQERTYVMGVSPYTNTTNYPWDVLEFPYAKIVEVDHTHYIVGNYVAFSISLAGSSMEFVSSDLEFGFSGGPLYAYFLIPAEYWDILCDVGMLDIYVDGIYWGHMRFFKFWF